MREIIIRYIILNDTWIEAKKDNSRIDFGIANRLWSQEPTLEPVDSVGFRFQGPQGWFQVLKIGKPIPTDRFQVSDGSWTEPETAHPYLPIWDMCTLECPRN